MDKGYADTVRLLLAITPEVFANDIFAMKGGTATNSSFANPQGGSILLRRRQSGDGHASSDDDTIQPWSVDEVQREGRARRARKAA
jgi:hypothetical protein